ncbi:AAA family ATPase [Candidatus Babela massiliensis]
MKIKDLSIYISNFKDMVQGDYLYVDKTKYIYKLFK